MGLFGNKSASAKPKKQLKETNINATVSTGKKKKQTKTEKENSTTYKFVESDFSRNSFYGSIGIEYKFAL